MFILYFIIVFFIIIFNVLIPVIIERIQLDDYIISSDLGKNLTKVTCKNNNWFYLEKSIFGLSLYYFVDEDNNILTCDREFENSRSIKCGSNGEFNNRYHPCFIMISELLFYKDSL